MLDGNLNLSSVYTSLHACELSFLLSYQKQFVSSLPAEVSLKIEVGRDLLPHKEKGTKLT